MASILVNPIMPSNIKSDIIIKTKKPIHIQTSFLQMDIAVALSIKEDVNNPLIAGKIQILSGTLAFPYRSLYITRGNLNFLPYQLDDPSIELIAKGTIKKYHITLRVHGSLKHPHITLESTPSLTEEQIRTLLLAGSEEGSVALVMPTLVLQNLENLIFGPE